MLALTHPALLFAAFALGSEAVVGGVLSTATGLAEIHKTILVGFVAAFPLLAMALIWGVLARMATAELSTQGMMEETGTDA